MTDRHPHSVRCVRIEQAAKNILAACERELAVLNNSDWLGQELQALREALYA